VGQKRIKTIDLSKTEKTKSPGKAEKFSDLSVAKKASKERKVPEEKKATREKVKKQTSLKAKKTHSRRYRLLRTKIDRKKLYPLDEAIKLLLKVANSKIDETVEVHCNTRIKKFSGTADLIELGKIKFKTEQKFPLLHLVIGKISFGEKKLLANLQKLIETVKPSNIKKAVLTSTHSPGIKLQV
jgi:ribosomal protein L1